MIDIYINKKKYKVREAITDELKKKGLLGVRKLPLNSGMLFYFNHDETPLMWMKDTKIPLDIIFIDKDFEVLYVYHAEPNDEKLVSIPKTKYVLELNTDSGVKKGDDVEIDDDDDTTPVMKVLALDGNTQMDLWGGERIFRRAFTKQLIALAKRALENEKNESEFSKLCRRIGKKMFREINAQDTREPEYVKSPEKD